MSKRRALGHGQPPPRPPPSLNSLLHEDSTSESEREDDEYAEQVQHFRAVFKRKLFSATSLDLEGWEPAEDDATASTASASEAVDDRCMQAGAQGHQHASLSRGEGSMAAAPAHHSRAGSHEPPPPQRQRDLPPSRTEPPAVASAASAAATTGPSASSPAAAPARRLFLRGCSALVSDQHLQQCFAQFGAVELAEVFYHPRTRQSMGMGCIIFVDASAAAKALAAAAQSSLYLANLWSPEVRLIADALGDYARQAYFDRVPDMQAQQQVAQQQDRQGQQAAQGQHAHAQQLQQAQQQMQQQIQQQMQHKQQQMQQFNGQ